MAASCINAAFGDPGNGGRLRTGLREKEANRSRSGKTVGKRKMEEVWTQIFIFFLSGLDTLLATSRSEQMKVEIMRHAGR